MVPPDSRSAAPHGGKLALLAVVGIVGLAAASAGGRWLGREPRTDPASYMDPREEPTEGYVGSDACLPCHPYQHASWDASYHSSMTQVATPRTVEAPFDGTDLFLEGVTWHVERRGEEFWVRGTEPLPDRTARLERRVVMTTGSHNYQMYWMQGDAGRGMQPFPLVYLLYDGIWIPRKSRFLTPPVERTPLETGRWSSHCVKCHATRGHPEPPPGGTTCVVELGISCEACHGPGSEHVHANRSPLRRFRLYAADAADPTIVNPSRLSHERSTQVCGQCHSIEILPTSEQAEAWLREGSRYRPGDDLAEFQTTVKGRLEDNPPYVQEYVTHHSVFRLRNCFWPDGMIRIAGREYHGMLETPCYQRGEMSCLSCHDLHRPRDDPRSFSSWADDQLGTGMRGDRACLQCHQRYEPPEAQVAHTHHPIGSTGSRCTNCHMPYTSWGLLRGIRSHTVDSPDVATSVETGRPNACNQCHLDRTLLWTAGRLETWYGIEPPALSEDQRTVAASILWALSGDAVQRALMAWSMGWEPARRASGTRWMVPYLCALLVDPYDAVRFNAQRTLRLEREYAAAASNARTGATRTEQFEIMRTVLGDWIARAPAPGDRARPDLLLLPDGRVDQARFKRFVAERNDDDLILFE